MLMYVDALGGQMGREGEENGGGLMIFGVNNLDGIGIRVIFA